MKYTFGMLAFGFGLGLAYVVGTRLSADALGILIGAGLMAVFAIGVILILIWSLGRRGQPESMPEPRGGHQQLPGNVFILPGGQPLNMPSWMPNHDTQSLPAPGPRPFRMIGEEWRDEES